MMLVVDQEYEESGKTITVRLVSAYLLTIYHVGGLFRELKFSQISSKCSQN